MKRWSEFLKLRRQHDVVKIICLYAAVGIFFLADLFINGIFFCREIGSSEEYIVTENRRGVLTEERLEEIRRLSCVADVSRQRVVTVTVKYKTNEAVFSCTELSEPYIKTAYGITESGAMKTFYMNQTAYDQLTQDVAGQEKNADKGRLRVSYTQEETEQIAAVSGTDNAAAVAVLITEGLPEEEPIVFCKGNSLGVSENVSQLRVLTERQDITGENVRRIQGLGFALENAQTVRESEYRRELCAVRMKYAGGMAAVSLTGACVISNVFCKKKK